MHDSFSLQLPFILASNSPRRKEILTQAGFQFAVLPSDVDESFSTDIPPQQVPVMLAERKAQALIESCGNSLVLAADTVVILENEILNKPADKQEALRMLQKLSGKTHEVVTGIALASPNGLVTASDSAWVRFRELADWEMEWYVRGGASLDKAGAYGVQDFIGMAGIEKLEGSFYTVMGLPIYQVYQLLKPFILESKQMPLGI
ncbi:Maf family protein [Aquirufa sp. OSTEICH-129V]|uniref:dTTP/UTP pyrophosphatase n=1 Tax=Aquirufa avitistagni TaxID=3104728 RepID=A0ABW6DF16_9BACT